MEKKVLSSGKKFIIATCGDWDLRYMLRNQLDVSKINDTPEYFKRWINIKTAFEAITGILVHVTLEFRHI